MALADIREQIAAILGAVDGVGVVHRYRRLAITWDKLLDVFKDSEGNINGWMITRTRTPAERVPMPHVTRRHTFQIYGIYGLRDDAASEITFQGILENIQNAFDAKFTLNDTCLQSGPVQVVNVDSEVMGNVLCHSAILEIQVTERVTYTVA